MATPRKIAVGFKPKSGSEARRDAKQELQRQQAVKAQSKTLLSPDEVAGEWDATRLLLTTIGGAVRPLTREDLATFRDSARKLKDKFKGGITAKQIIDLSWQDDRKRAHEQIKYAMPVSAKDGVIHFQTNAGPDSDRTHHQVFVQLLNYSAAVASPKPALKIVGEVLKGKVRFDCDCGRHRFWFRYVATVGNYNYRVAETNFPKIRNPQLSGIACKHVLRVMTAIAQSPTIKQYVANLIDKARKTEEVKREDVKKREAQALVEQMAQENWRQRAVRTTHEKKPKRSAQAEADLVAKQQAKARQKAIASSRKKVENNLRTMLSLGAINQSQYDAMLRALDKE